MNNDELPVLTNFFLIPAQQLSSNMHNTKQEELHVKSNKKLTNNGNMYIQSIDALIWESNNNKGSDQHV